jgi:hypothetical protein
MRGSVPRGCRLMINGASLLLEEGETNDDTILWGTPDCPAGGGGPGNGGGGGGGNGGGGSGNARAGGAGGPPRRARPPSWAGGGGSWGLAGGSLVCELSWMRFRALVDSLDLVCGIYVQARGGGRARGRAARALGLGVRGCERGGGGGSARRRARPSSGGSRAAPRGGRGPGAPCTPAPTRSRAPAPLHRPPGARRVDGGGAGAGPAGQRQPCIPPARRGGAGCRLPGL